MATEWSLDFCLVCDRQTLGGPYCSQACRLAELDLIPETATIGIPISVHGQNSQTIATDIAASASKDGYCQDLDRVSVSRPNNLPTSSQILSTSSSQTSLSSLKSKSSQFSASSDQFENQLRDYANCFDQVRDFKRRLAS
ncbi:hypothetical protein BDV23DRAFT_148173 [Aspergillus alliaceus]|uniref:Uncharacterized protein n=1 Tax=Petromyces alliaceus TaxID=209559 RepID=A0A5N6FI11_PETAA|nr:uncharacterized protein BDW43DRAFT_190781 [Aspergillus alliaceus]KAB8229257.1 hypothetical protein BDW43DRAFT_190781 [Aspergillus alliaceus]KAE8393901.1 hypothetical protein BDV23DRAFT_148173 [Aspergillus alliaceus]